MGISTLDQLADYIPGTLGGGYHGFCGSRVLQSNVAAGCFVVPTDEGQCDLATTAAQVQAGNGGILIQLIDRNPKANGLEYASGELCNYCTEGYIVAVTDTAVSDMDPVFVVLANGHLRNTGGTGADTLTLTVTSTADAFRLALIEDGVDLSFTSGSSQTAAQKATAWAAAIDALTNYTAAAVGAVVTVTKVAGAVNVQSYGSGFTLAHTPAAVRLPGARFARDAVSGAALVKLRP